MGNCISNTVNQSVITTATSVSRADQFESSAAPSEFSPLRRTYSPNLPAWSEEHDRWHGLCGRLSMMFRPAGFVSYQSMWQALPEKYRSPILHYYRESSELNQAMRSAFQQLDAEALSERGLNEVFIQGRHPERFESLLRLVRMGELDAARCTPERMVTSTTVETHHMNLAHRMACFITEPDSPGAMDASVRFSSLSKAMSLDSANSHGWTAVHFAARFDNPVAMRALVSRRIDLNATTESGHTALMIAAEYAHPETVRLLLKRSVEWRQRERSDESLLESVAGAGIDEIPPNKLTDVNRRSLDQQVSGLHIAVGRRTEFGRAIATLLIQSGADISLQDAAGRTPVHYAVRNRDVQMLDVLLAGLAEAKAQGRNFGAPNWADFNGETPLQVARRLGDVHIEQRLLAYGADPDLGPSRSVTSQDVSCFGEAPRSLLRTLRESSGRQHQGGHPR